MPTLYAPRIRIHEVLERNKAVTTTLPVYRDGALVAPSSGTFTLIQPSGADVIAATAIAVVGDVAQFSILAAQVPTTLALSEGYIEHWDLVIGGITYNFQRPAVIARRALYPVISDIDLIAQYSDLASVRPSSMTSYQSYIDEAWYQIISKLRAKGNLEYLILDPQSLRLIHIDWTMYLVFKDFDSTGLGEGRYMELAREHKGAFHSGFSSLNFRYDLSNTGTATDANKRTAASPVIFLSDPPPWNRTRWGW